MAQNCPNVYTDLLVHRSPEEFEFVQLTRSYRLLIDAGRHSSNKEHAQIEINTAWDNLQKFLTRYPQFSQKSPLSKVIVLND